jgi:proteasome lid subunit RPN8/RPN11
MFGRRKQAASKPSSLAAPTPPSLGVVRVDAPLVERDLGRRDVRFEGVRRLHLPSLVIDQTEAMLRRHGLGGEEGIGIWAGTLAGGDGFVSTLVLPSVTGHGRHHGEISEETMASAIAALDRADLVAIAQVHSHPRGAYLSEVDAERPALAVPGFISIVVPEFGFVDVADVSRWAAYEFLGGGDWQELNAGERAERLIVDPSFLVVP